MNIDYELDSDEEWNELNAENLDDDHLLMEDETSDLNGDDPELKREGFIVADDFHSESSQSYDDDDDTKIKNQRKELWRRYQERRD